MLQFSEMTKQFHQHHLYKDDLHTVSMLLVTNGLSIFLVECPILKVTTERLDDNSKAKS